MTRTSIKKVKYDGRAITSLGYPTAYQTFDSDKYIISKKGRETIMGMIDWLRQDYAENNESIGVIKAKYYFEPFMVDLGHKTETGGMMFDGTNMRETVYELVLEISVPFAGTNLVDVHTYRLGKHDDWEHISTEVW